MGFKFTVSIDDEKDKQTNSTRKDFVSKPLSPFDKLILGSCLAEQLAGNSTTTIINIWRNISEDNREPEPEMREKILESIERMSVIKLHSKYVLPCETMVWISNNIIIKSFIRFLGNSVLLELYQYANDKNE